MKPTKLIPVMLMIVACTMQSYAQTMTYNHDASKCGQIQVMELGAGALTPDWYYSVTHNSYKKGAKSATSVKIFFSFSRPRFRRLRSVAGFCPVTAAISPTVWSKK